MSVDLYVSTLNYIEGGIIMSKLFRRSSIFADIKNVIVNTDYIVASRLERYFKEHPEVHIFFTEDLFKLLNIPQKVLKYKIFADKKSHNFLLDYFKWEIIETLGDGVNPITLCEYIYHEVLKLPIITNDVLDNMDISDVMTGIGGSFQILCADNNLDALYLYRDSTITDDIIKGLNFSYSGHQKIKFISGDKQEFIKDNPCDSYFLEDSLDIDRCLMFKHTKLSEVLVPSCTPNLTIVGQEQSTRLRLLILNMPAEYYQDNFNLAIHTIGLPI